MHTTDVDAGDLAEGDLVMIDDEPCLIRSAETSSAGGKHGTAKVTIEAVTLADESEKSLTQPEDGALDVPVFETGSNPLILVGDTDPHFDPLGVHISPGGNVVWLWDDDEAHQIVAEDGSFESDRDSGEGFTFEHAFDDPGIYAYGCAEHDGLGVVVVEESHTPP